MKNSIKDRAKKVPLRIKLKVNFWFWWADIKHCLKLIFWIINLLILIIAVGIGWTLVLIHDLLTNGAGILSILAFMAGAIVIGAYSNFVIDKIKDGIKQVAARKIVRGCPFDEAEAMGLPYVCKECSHQGTNICNGCTAPYE